MFIVVKAFRGHVDEVRSGVYEGGGRGGIHTVFFHFIQIGAG